MQKQDIITTINRALENEFEVSENYFTSDADVRSVLSLDSLDIVDLIVIIETNFGIKVTKEELMKVTTFCSLYDLIYNKVNL